MLNFLLHGMPSPAFADLLLRVGVGSFFAISGYHKIFNADRHAHLRQTLLDDHIPWASLNEWFVPWVELVAGTTLILGLFSFLSSLLLTCVCVVAVFCEAPGKVAAYHPVDPCDTVDDYLYLPETLLLLILFALALFGPGDISLDAFLF